MEGTINLTHMTPKHTPSFSTGSPSSSIIRLSGVGPQARSCYSLSILPDMTSVTHLHLRGNKTLPGRKYAYLNYRKFVLRDALIDSFGEIKHHRGLKAGGIPFEPHPLIPLKNRLSH